MINEKDSVTKKDKDIPKVSRFWKYAALVLLGVVIGFSFAPIKKGIYCGNNNSVYNVPSDDFKKSNKHKKCKTQNNNKK